MKLRETAGRHRESIDRQINLEHHLIVYLLWVLLISAIAIAFANFSTKLQPQSTDAGSHTIQIVLDRMHSYL